MCSVTRTALLMHSAYIIAGTIEFQLAMKNLKRVSMHCVVKSFWLFYSYAFELRNNVEQSDKVLESLMQTVLEEVMKLYR